MSNPQIVKYIPKTLYSNYSLLTISDIVSEINETKEEPKTQSNLLELNNSQFKVSQRKVLRSSKR
jgi:hypothetical protein